MNTQTQISPLTKEVILNILNDAVIFDRVCSGIMKVLNGSDDWCEVQGGYKGVNSALLLLNIDVDSKSADEMRDIFMDNSADRHTNSLTAAENILKEWQKEFLQ